MKLRIDWVGIGMFLLMLLFLASIVLGVSQYNHSVATNNSNVELNDTTQTGVDK